MRSFPPVMAPAVVLMLSLTTAWAQEGTDSWLPQKSSCGAWTAASLAPKTEEIHFRILGWWLQGFLSGVGVTHGLAPDGLPYYPLKGMDSPGVFAWIDNYCKAHPIENIDDAGWAFVVAHPH
jgi:hypothetical protein